MDFLIELCILIIVVYLLLEEYANRNIKRYVFMLTYVSWLLSFGIVVILPCDIYYSRL